MEHELHEAVRVRDQLLDEASRLLAGGSGEDSPEYEEFLRLRTELPQISRTRDLDHCMGMVRTKTKELRKWLHRMDRALGTTDPVDGIVEFMKMRLQTYMDGGVSNPAAVSCLADIIVAVERGDWVPKMEDTDA